MKPSRGPDRLSFRPPELLTELVSWYCWAVLSCTTAFFYSLGRVLELCAGPRVWPVLLHAWARANIAAGGFRVRAAGLSSLPRPAVLVANHQSVFDIPLLAGLVPPPVAFAARSDLAAHPIVGSVLRRGGHILLDRDGQGAGRRAVDEAVRRLAEGCVVIFFAEGTRSPDGAVREFHSGAFHAARGAGCPLVPVAVAGTRYVVAKGSRRIRPCHLAVTFLEELAPESRSGATTRWRRLAREEVARTARTLESIVGPRFGARRMLGVHRAVVRNR